MTPSLSIILVLLGLTGPSTTGSRDLGDRELILEHIHRIFRAYVAGDREAIERMHTSDWIGFLGPSTRIERGIDAYMRNADRSLASFKGTGYEILDVEIEVHGNLAVVYYTARYDYRDNQGREGSLPLRSIDIYRKEAGAWNQCGSHITPVPRGGSWGEGDGPALRTLADAEREELLAAREAVWRAWFAGDQLALRRLVPEETIAIDPGVEEWADLEESIRRAEAFRDGGARLIRLDFPRTRIQAYGEVAILYTEYLFELDDGEVPKTVSGRGTEVFVKREGRWLNSGWHLDSGR